MFQVFHCVHFECPADPQALVDYEASMPASPSQVSLSEEDSDAGEAPSRVVSAAIPAPHAGPPIFQPQQMVAPPMMGAAHGGGDQPPAQGMGGHPAGPPTPPTRNLSPGPQ